MELKNKGKIIVLMISLILLVLMAGCQLQQPGTEQAAGKGGIGKAITAGCYDADNDGYGRPDYPTYDCPRGNSTLTDCNDMNASISPGAQELCNSIDENCDGISNETCLESACNNMDDNANGLIDEGCDKDGDDYCDWNFVFCMPPSSRVDVCPWGGGDCNDANMHIHPNAVEVNVCDTVDENCDGRFFEDCTNCTDSDGGNNPLVGGFTNTTSPDWLSSRTDRDLCLSNILLNETICQYLVGNGTVGKSVIVNCRDFGGSCYDPDGRTGTVPAVCR